MEGKARYREADRQQVRWEMVDLESLLPMDHRARVVWAFVVSLDLSELYDRIGSREGGAGRPPADPRILLALWLYATLEGVGSARQLDRLCERDVAYRWLCGGVTMNYHALSDFRCGHADILDRLLTQSLTALVAEGLVTLEEIALDGTKVRASAGKGSFRSEKRLASLEEAARQRVNQLKEEVATNPASGEKRRQAAQLRAAEEAVERAAAARAVLEQLQAEKAERAKTHKTAEAKKGEVRVSTTDPEARRMRFADGSTQAGYNIQLGTTPVTGIIASVETTDRRNDAGMAQPMVDQAEQRTGLRPDRALADTTYATREDVVAFAEKGIEVYTPVPADKTEVKPETLRKRAWERSKEPESVKAWRERMASEAGKETYRRRSWSETINGILKGRGMAVMRVRSRIKVHCVVLLHVLAHNLWRAHGLRTAAA